MTTEEPDDEPLPPEATTPAPPPVKLGPEEPDDSPLPPEKPANPTLQLLGAGQPYRSCK